MTGCYCCAGHHWTATTEGVIFDRGGSLRLLDALRRQARLQRAGRLHATYRARRRGKMFR